MTKRRARVKGKNTATTTPVAVAPTTQVVNGGELLVGNPGNAGGLGRPPSLIRARMRGSFWDRVQILEDIADGKCLQDVVTKSGVIQIGPSCADRRGAIETMGRYAGIEKVTVEADPERPTISGDEVLRRILPVMERLAGMNAGVDRLAKAQAVEAQIVDG